MRLRYPAFWCTLFQAHVVLFLLNLYGLCEKRNSEFLEGHFVPKRNLIARKARCRDAKRAEIFLYSCGNRASMACVMALYQENISERVF